MSAPTDDAAPHAVDPADEGRHTPEDARLFNESWYFDFVADAGTGEPGAVGGWIRVGLYPNVGVAWYNAFLVGSEFGAIAAVDFAAPLPEEFPGPVVLPALRGHHVCKDPLSLWRVGAAGTGRRITDPADGYRLPDAGGDAELAFDLEWQTAGTPFHYVVTPRYEIPCLVRGTMNVDGREIAVEGSGQRDHSWAVRDWWQVGWLWTSGRLEDGTYFHAAHIALPGSPVTFGYIQGEAKDLTVVSASQAGVTLDAERVPTASHIHLEPQQLGMAIEPIAHAGVLLQDEDGRTSHFPRAMCRFSETGGAGRTGLGWTEWNMPAGADLSGLVE